MLGQTLAAAIADERHVPMLDSIVPWAGRTLDANEDLIREMVHERAGWMMRSPGSTSGSPTRLSTASAA